MSSLADVPNSVFGALAAVAALWIFRIYKETQQEAARFSRLVAGIGAPAEDGSRSLEHSGHSIRVKFHPGSSKLDPRRLVLSVPFSGGSYFQVIPNSFEYALEKDVETGDKDFSSRFHVRADNMPFAGAYFSSAKKREAVKLLFAEGCSEVKFYGARIEAIWTVFPETDDRVLIAINRSVQPLSVLAQGIPPLP